MTEKSYALGLASEERYRRFLEKKEIVEKEKKRLEKLMLEPETINDYLQEKGSTPVAAKISMIDLLKRPQVSYEDLQFADPDRPRLSDHARAQLEVQIKYEGYITKQEQQILKFKKLEDKKLDPDFDYEKVDGLRIEARQKLNQFKPVSLGQASRISGVSPADINVLLIHLEKMRRKKS